MAEYNDKKDLTMVPLNEQEAEELNPNASKFLKWQDKNGDGLPDVCLPEVVPTKVCLDCVPNPYAILANWRNRDQTEPILNEKNCTYQITMVTPRTTTGYTDGMSEEDADAALKEIFEYYQRDAIQILLEEFQKDDSEATIDQMVQVVEHTDFDLEPRDGSRLKLLYSLPFEQVFNLPELKVEEEDDDPKPDDVTIKWRAASVTETCVKLRKGLNLYNRYLKVYKGTQGGNLKFKETKNIFNLEDYGDSSVFGSSMTERVFVDLDSWLDSRGYTFSYGFWDFFSTNQQITDITMVFDGEWNIKKLSVYTEACKERPKVYGNSRLRSLRRRKGWRDKTAVAYFAQMNPMVADISARRPAPWIDFLTQYTYPEIFAEVPDGDLEDGRTISSCIADNLEKEFKDLGQDIFDDVFSIGDAIAKAFHDKLCAADPDTMDKNTIGLGLNPSVPAADIWNMQSAAQMQKFFTVDETDPIFVNMCKRALLYHGFGGSSMKQLDDLYKHGLGPLKICGLFDLLFEAMECLFKGLSLEEALGRIILAALKAMGVEDFGKLFVGLPPEKRAELDALVKKNLKSGKSFAALGDKSAKAEDAPFMGTMNIPLPWENKKFVEQQKKAQGEDNFGAKVPSKNKAIANHDPTVERRTLGQQLGGPSEQEKSQLDPSKVFEAYILALVEVYQDNYLALLDKLSDFPGAQLISAVIGLLNCPIPPLFNPGIMDFIKSLGLPFCRNHQDIISPRFENPFANWPKLSDILWYLFIILRYLIIQLLLKILLAILSKVCEIIGNAICKALETVGAVAGSLPGILSGRVNVLDVIRDTICGPGAPDLQVEDTIVDLVAQLGTGGAAFADRERTINFFADALNSMTREEAIEAFINGPSDTTLEIIDKQIEFDHDWAREGLPSKTAISRFFKNIGNLIPAETKDELQNYLGAIPEELGLPANPSICATPEEIALFEEGRCALLEGRVSPDQCVALNERAKLQLLDDLDDIAKLAQEGVPNIIEANMPPVFSDPNCSNGLLPLEPPEQAYVATETISGDLDKLQLAFTTDMLGDAGWFSSQDDWGFLNMVLSDTYGNPFTIHQEKVANGGLGSFVDYYGQNEQPQDLGPPEVPDNPFMLPVWLIGLMVWIAALPFIVIYFVILSLFKGETKGAYPKYVASYLRNQFLGLGDQPPRQGGWKEATDGASPGAGSSAVLGSSTYTSSDLHDGTDYDMRTGASSTSMVFKSNNNYKGSKKFWKSFDDAGFIWRFLFISDTDVELVDLPNYGYNTKLKVNYASERLAITRKPRKKDPDILLLYKDNANGYRSGHGSDGANWRYGFAVKAYYSDLIERDGIRSNRADDNVRVVVRKQFNPPNETAVSFRTYEFLAADAGFENLEIENFPSLQRTTQEYMPYSPAVGALSDLSNGSLSIEAAEQIYDRVNQLFYETFSMEIGLNAPAWEFGFGPDTLVLSDYDMGVKATPKDVEPNGVGVGDWIPYYDYQLEEVDDDGEPIPGGKKGIEEEDGIMAISWNQYQNESAGTPAKTRVFYLDPGKFGGSYYFPPVYTKPQATAGWAGIINLMFPERSPCSPKSQGLVRLDEIQAYISKTYSTIPEDKRLMGDEDCIFEAPFNRILTRSSKAAIRGLILSAIRIYGSTHFIKSIATFSQFGPDFKANYSKIYAGYVVERMKSSLMDSGGNFLNPFNDTEFWYAFLEQSVQFYSDRLDDDNDEEITPDTCPMPVQDALQAINDVQATYVYPYDFDDYNNDDYGTFESMKSFRESKNLEAVKSVEHHAKLVLQELVAEQLDEIGKGFIKNCKHAGFDTPIVDMDYYFFEKFCGGGETLSLHGTPHESPLPGGGIPSKDDPSWPGPYYSNGDILALPSGTPYTGYFHGAYDVADGSTVYMVGEEHVTEPHDRLIPFAKKLQVVMHREVGGEVIKTPMGDVTSATSPSTDSSKDFYLHKYTIVNGERKTDTSAISQIRGLGGGNLSDHYPGTLQLVKTIDPETDEEKVIGIEGNLGVQHVLEFGIAGSNAFPIASVSIDALDVRVPEYTGIEPNSKLLLCLINQLKDDPIFRLAVDYIFSMKKALAMLAIYNDLGFTASIGELTVADGDMFGGSFEPTGISADTTLKPGFRVTKELVDPPDPEGGYDEGNRPEWPLYDYNVGWTEGWASYDDRNSMFSSFGYLDYDEWDRITLRKSASRLKKLFKPHYRTRKFGVDDGDSGGRNALAEITNAMVSRFRFSPARQVLPWYRQGQIRSNPFDENGNMCSKSD